MDQFEEADAERHINADQIKQLITQCVGSMLGTNPYNAQKVDQWVSTIIENILKGLQAMEKPYKFLVTCTLMQKTGGGLHTVTQCLWDLAEDSYITEKYDNETMQAVTTVYCLTI